jgi:hypothetical protein
VFALTEVGHSFTIVALRDKSACLSDLFIKLEIISSKGVAVPTCERCGKDFYPGDGIFEDGDSLCGECLAVDVSKALEKEERVQKARDKASLKVK